MTFTRSWVHPATSPGNGDQRRYAAQKIRELRDDIAERLETFAVADMEADPLALLPAVSGEVTSKFLYMPVSAFKGITSSTDYVLSSEGSRLTATDTDVFYAPIYLPPGVTLKGFTLLGDTNLGTASTSVLDLKFVGWATPTIVSTLATASMTGANGTKSFPSGAISITLSAGALYFELYVGHSDHWFYGMCVEYGCPSHLTTI